MRQKILDLLMIVILVLSGILLLSSAVVLFVELNDTFPLQTLQSYMGIVLLGFDVALVIMNLWTKHPFFEYWLVIMIGGIVGAIYAAR